MHTATIASAICRSRCGSTNTAPPAATSDMGGRFDVTTGSPTAWASRIGSPKPSCKRRERQHVRVQILGQQLVIAQRVHGLVVHSDVRQLAALGLRVKFADDRSDAPTR